LARTFLARRDGAGDSFQCFIARHTTEELERLGAYEETGVTA
jgi:hypothetical protein